MDRAERRRRYRTAVSRFNAFGLDGATFQASTTNSAARLHAASSRSSMIYTTRALETMIAGLRQSSNLAHPKPIPLFSADSKTIVSHSNKI